MARGVVQSLCSRFSSVLTLSALRAAFVVQRKPLKEPRQTDRKPKSFAARTHCLPGAKFEHKKGLYLFLLFINPEAVVL